MNGFLFTADGKLICEVLESTKISPNPYKDRRIVKIQCVNCGKARKVQKWRFDSVYGPSNKEKYFECKWCHAMTLFQIRGGCMTNGDFIRSMTDEDITENFTPGICDLIKHRDPERCQNREHCFHCVKDWLKEKNTIMVRADQWTRK